MSGYYRAAVLDLEVHALDSRWPHRDRKSDGWIGDAAHRKRKSDHNPDWSSKPPGVVRAEDTDTDGIHVPTVLAACFLNPATHYVIFQRTIWTSERRFKPARYLGTPHPTHIHESILPGHEHGSPNGWSLITTSPYWGSGVRQGAKGRTVREVQAYLLAFRYSLTLDGDFGAATDAALRRFQARHKLAVDGIAGRRTLAKFRSA